MSLLNMAPRLIIVIYLVECYELVLAVIMSVDENV